MDTSSAEFKAALRDHAKSLGVDPDADAHLMALVEEALLADIPDGWEQGETEDGTLYYFNTETEESIWEHPLDAHYRELIRAKQQEHAADHVAADATRPVSSTKASPAVAAAEEGEKSAKAPTATPISSIEVYSFDEDSDDEVVPMPKASAAVAKESDKSSRISSLFSQPAAPSTTSSAAATTTGASTTGGIGGDAAASSSSAQSTVGLAKSETSNSGGGGFGRDRSWLLDGDDDDVVGFSSLGKKAAAGGGTASSLSTPASSLSSLQVAKIESFGGRDDDTFAGSKSSFSASSASRSGAAYSPSSITTTASPTAATTTASSLSFSSRMYGASTSPSAASTKDMSSSSGGGAATAVGSSGSGTSPRRGIGSSIKNQFFQEMPSSTTPAGGSTAFTPSSGASLPADIAKIQQLEKKVSELTKQNEQLTSDLQKARQQVEHAQLEAKESNYLKMKANESKTKLAEKDAELKQLAQDHAAVVTKLQLELQQLKSEGERLAKTQLQHASAASQEAIEMQRGAMTEKAALQGEISELERKLRDALQESASHQSTRAELAAKVATLESTLERERREHASEASALRDSAAQRRKDHDTELELLRGQLEALKRELTDTARRNESVGVVQDTLERQTKFLKEVEEKNRDLQSKLALAEESAAAAAREAKAREQETSNAVAKHRAALIELEAKDKHLGALSEKLRLHVEQVAALEYKSASLVRQEDEFKHERAQAEREARSLTNELKDRSEELQRLQSQIRRQSEEHMTMSTKLHVELQEAQNQLKAVKMQEVAPLEKQCEQLRREHERLSERLALQDKEHRHTKHELAESSNQIHQLQGEVEAWKRKEQQQKAQRDAFGSEKLALEKHAASLEAEHAAYKNTKRLEVEKLTFRMRELESQLAQKDYEVLRVEERFTKAEAWRLKEARRVEERDSQLLDVKEELAQLKSRNIDAENAVVIQELRREREQLQHRVEQLMQQLEEEKLARQVSGQKFHDELNMMQKGLEWQLPQLAAACVNRSSEEWVRKCHEVVKALRDNFNLKALAERNALLGQVKRAEDAREHVERKYKDTLAECEFLRKEVHRVEDNNKVLLDQLHTVRVYMTQRSMPATFPPAPPWTSPHSSPGGAGPTAPHHHHQQPPPPPPSAFGVPFTDFSTINHLNTQLGVLHAQFQQLFDATERRPPGVSLPKPHFRFSPSDRFEIPSSPPPAARHPQSPDATRSASPARAPSVLDQTMDVLLDQSLESSSRRTAADTRSKELEKEQLISTLESLALSPAPATAPPDSTSALALEDPLTAAEGSAWYQRDYWRSKYQ